MNGLKLAHDFFKKIQMWIAGLSFARRPKFRLTRFSGVVTRKYSGDFPNYDFLLSDEFTSDFATEFMGEFNTELMGRFNSDFMGEFSS